MSVIAGDTGATELIIVFGDEQQLIDRELGIDYCAGLIVWRIVRKSCAPEVNQGVAICCAVFTNVQ